MTRLLTSFRVCASIRMASVFGFVFWPTGYLFIVQIMVFMAVALWNVAVTDGECYRCLWTWECLNVSRGYVLHLSQYGWHCDPLILLILVTNTHSIFSYIQLLCWYLVTSDPNQMSVVTDFTVSESLLSVEWKLADIAHVWLQQWDNMSLIILWNLNHVVF